MAEAKAIGRVFILFLSPARPVRGFSLQAADCRLLVQERTDCADAHNGARTDEEAVERPYAPLTSLPRSATRPRRVKTQFLQRSSSQSLRDQYGSTGSSPASNGKIMGTN
jgi:hypothetical protein